MRLLIITQKVDKDDPVLGFFHRWLQEFSKNFESLVVICLGKGSFDLPENVKVLSLGKPFFAKASQGRGGRFVSSIIYVLKFYKYIWQERSNYDGVFVHMNQEYVLLSGDMWWIWGKKVYLWRNHPHGDLRTRLAGFLSDKVFYTSPRSYTAGFKNSQIMPVGIDTEFFKSDPSVTRIPNSVLFLGRIAPVKKVLEFVEWFNTLDEKFTATVAGAALPKDESYEQLVRSKASNRIKFIGSVTQDEALKLYQSHETYVNKTPAGSMDKTIFEAAACGMKLIVDNPDAQNINISNHSLKKLAEELKKEIS